MMTSAKVVETSVTSTDNSRPYLKATQPNNQVTRQNVTTGLKPLLNKAFDNFGYISQPTFFLNIKFFDVLILGDRF